MCMILVVQIHSVDVLRILKHHVTMVESMFRAPFWIDIPILEKIMSASLTTKQVVVAKFLRHFFQGGIYVLNVIDSQSVGLSLVFVVIFEAVAVSWGYGRYLYSRCSRGVVYR